MVATRDIGGKAAEFLDRLDFKGKSAFEFGGPKNVTLKEAAAILGGAVGKPDLSYVQFSYGDARKGMVDSGMRPGMADLMIEMNRAFNEGRLEPTQKLDDGHRGATTLEEFAADFAEAFRRG
jgi:hypothetical protein